MFEWLHQFVFSIWGMVVLSVLDSSLVFFLPLAIDGSVIGVISSHRDLFWLLPVAASAGSIVGAAFTYWIGAKLGEPGLERIVSEKQLKRVRHKISNKGAVALALPALIPPPFPFTPWILMCGALNLSRKTFLLTLFATRLIRFEIEGILAHYYGQEILRWLESDVADGIVIVMAIIAVIGTFISGYRLWKTTHA